MGKADGRSTMALLLRHAPAGARAYYLVGDMGRFPPVGGLSLVPFQPPFRVPMGQYYVNYLEHVNSDNRLPGKNPRVPAPILNLFEPHQAASRPRHLPVSTPMPSPMGIAAPSSVPPLPLSPPLPRSNPPQPSEPTRRKEDPALSDPEYVKHRVEYLKQTMKDQIVTNRQLAGKQLTIHQEMGEQFVLSRAYRQELASTSHHSNEVVRRGLELSREVMNMTMEQAEMVKARMLEYTKPTRPIDYVPAIVELLKETAPIVRDLIGAVRTDPAQQPKLTDAKSTPSEKASRRTPEPRSETEDPEPKRAKKTEPARKGKQATPARGAKTREDGKKADKQRNSPSGEHRKHKPKR